MQPTFYFDIIFSTINFLFTGKSPFHFSIHGIDTLFITQFAWHTNSHSYIVTWTPPANLAATLSANSFIIYLPRKAASSWRPHRHTNRYNQGAGLTFWPFGAPQPRHLTGYSRAVGSGAPSRGEWALSRAITALATTHSRFPICAPGSYCACAGRGSQLAQLALLPSTLGKTTQ